MHYLSIGIFGYLPDFTRHVVDYLIKSDRVTEVALFGTQGRTTHDECSRDRLSGKLCLYNAHGELPSTHVLNATIFFADFDLYKATFDMTGEQRTFVSELKKAGTKAILITPNNCLYYVDIITKKISI